MNAEIKAIIEQAHDRYLKAEDLGAFQAYINSLPDRLTLYRLLRDREISILQLVATQLEAVMPKVETKQLENGIKHLSLVLRYSAMAMLMQDLELLNQRLLNWLSQVVGLQETQSLNQELFGLLSKNLGKELSRPQLELLSPFLSQAQATLTA
jgi:Phycobilisome protein